MDTRGLPYPKPESRRRTKGRKARLESEAKTSAREQCVERDGTCRLSGIPRLLHCDGPSEWAHLGGHRRSLTRGMDPTERHRRDKSLMLCRLHHALYDGRQRHHGERLSIEELTTKGADGPLRYSLAGQVYEEPR